MLTTCQKRLLATEPSAKHAIRDSAATRDSERNRQIEPKALRKPSHPSQSVAEAAGILEERTS
jgi:hypothetical protein